MLRPMLLSLPLLLVPVATPAWAQAGTVAADPKKCELSTTKKRGSSMLGGMLGGLANRALGRAGGLAAYIPVNSAAHALTDAIACKLDQDEQKKAAGATDQAVRGGVGTSANWTSTTRTGVSGSSTVLAQSARADGASCLTVNDVVIVNGEETTVAKQMCRAPGASGYTLAA